MTTTTIKVHISAADSIKHACQCGWVRFQVDFAEWSVEERAYLAGLVKDDEGATLDRSIAPPTAERLLDWLRAQLAEKAGQAGRQAAEDIATARTNIERKRTESIDRLSAKIDLFYFCGYSDRRNVALDAIGQAHTDDGYVTPEQLGRGEEWAQYLAEKAAKEAAEKAAKEADAARITEANARAEENFKLRLAAVPSLLREKYESGFANRAQVDEVFKAQLLKEFGLDADTTGYEESIKTLSDSEFIALKAAREEFPEFEVNPYLVWDWRKATDDDESEDVDRDGEVKVSERIIQILLERHGVTAIGKIPMPTE